MRRLVFCLVFVVGAVPITAFAQMSNGTVNAKQATGATWTVNQGGTWTVQPGNTANTTPWLVKTNDGTNSITIKAASTTAVATDTALVVSQRPIADPVCTSFAAISQTSGTTVITGSSGKKIYICAIALVVNPAEVVSIVEGTGTVCATGGSAIYGSTTAANGMPFAANGGMTQASYRPFMVTSTATDNLCVIQSGSSRVTGSISYVLQ